VPIVEIAWARADALPFALPIAARSEGTSAGHLSVARGNMVLADHGRTIAAEDLPPVPVQGQYRPRLQRLGLTHRVPYDDVLARQQPAAALTLQDPHAAVPVLTLQEADTGPGHAGALWVPRRDLLNSDRFARECVVEMEHDGSALLRFGNGVQGKQPVAGSHLTAHYRIGNGPAGNVGHDAIAHVFTREARITAVRNPLAAQGGCAPEAVEHVRLMAPWAFHTQERCVTAADYVAVAQRHPEVQQAAATLRWSGSWYTAFVAVHRRDDLPVDAAFRDEMLAFMARFRLAGHDLEIVPPRFAPLDIALTATLAPDHFGSTVRQALRETFSRVDLPNGRRGFFHPAHFPFGQPVYLSPLVTAAMQVPGVVQVRVTRFQRWGRPDRGELAAAQIPIGPLEIARLDSDAAAPENGTITFTVEGGR
jgi:predicted phage baseplate assembly protein